MLFPKMDSAREFADFIASDYFKGIENIVILGTGPSLNDFSLTSLENKKNTVIVALKQSIKCLPCNDIKLLHLLNPWNLEKYDYKNCKHVKVIYYHDIAAKFYPNESQFDYTFVTKYETPLNLEKSALALCNYDNIKYDNLVSRFRPVMPGIFPEALMLAWYFQPKNIYLFGVDYFSGQKKNHFYDKNRVITKVLKFITKPKLMKKLFFFFGLRTEYSSLLKAEENVAIPGIGMLISYITKTSSTKVHGWKHSISFSNKSDSK